MGRARFVIVGALTALAMVGTMAARTTAVPTHKRPALRISAVSGAAYAHSGGTIEVRAKVRAHAKHRAGKAHWYLSRDRRHSRGDVKLRPAVRIKKLRAGHATRLHRILDLPSPMAAGRYHLVVCARGAKCASAKATVRVGTRSITTSGALIDKALVKHQISRARAITYRVLGEVGDPHLPARFRGDPVPDASDSIRAAAAAWSTLSRTQRRLLQPYLQGPSYGANRAARAARGTDTKVACAKQHLDRAHHVDSPDGHIRVWYPKSDESWARADRAAAPALARQAQHIWNKYAALLGRTPPSDAHEKCGNGGDGHYDIYLDYNVGGYAWTGIYKGHGGTGGPSFTVFSTWAGSPPNRWELAHELFHAFQFSYHYAAAPGRYAAFDEGAANWAANYAYPADDLEHYDAGLLKYPGYRSLTWPVYSYDDWPFDLYLTERYGDSMMRWIYERFTKQAPWDAVDGLLNGGLDKVWPDFTRFQWNQEPVKGGLRSWDHWSQVPEVSDTVTQRPVDVGLGGLAQRTLNMRVVGIPMTSQFHPVHLLPGSNVREIVFDNTIANRRHVTVQAYLKHEDGTWELKDWSDEPTVDMCLTSPGQDVTDLMVMYSFTDHTNRTQRSPEEQALTIKPHRQPTMTFRNTCAKYLKVTGVGGSYDMTYDSTTTGPDCTYAAHDHYETTMSKEPDDGYDIAFDETGGTGIVPVHKSGSATGEVTCPGAPGDNDSCTRSLDDEGSYYLDIDHVAEDKTATLRFHALQQPYNDCSGVVKDGGEVTGVTDPKISVSVPWSSLLGLAPFTVHAEGTFDDPTHQVTREYSLTLQRVDRAGRPLQ